ncbi:unnamed protein product, partial [Mesorhabditis belari]|uniref:IgGFc-binding protein N-terminal domain-containing protein n=1 Tax=Mesorhabditis belari TaxID=2138241 RepID=A0AAF3ER42_9BILA
MVFWRFLGLLGLLVFVKALPSPVLQRGHLTSVQESNEVHPAVLSSTLGNSFLFSIPNMHYDDSDQSYTERISLIVTNYDTNKTATVTVSTPSAIFNTTTFTIQPLKNYKVSLPAEIQTNYRNRKVNYFSIETKSISVTADTKVTVVAQNEASNGYGAGMFVVFPLCSLSTTYRTMADDIDSGRKWNKVANSISIIATQDNTRVSINPVITNPPTITLNSGEVMILASDSIPLINYEITSNYPVAVVTGTDCGYGYRKLDSNGCDYEATMSFPGPGTAGTAFAFQKFMYEDQGVLVILGTENNTIITANGRALDMIDAFGYSIYLVQSTVCLTTNKPVYVYASSIESRMAGVYGSPLVTHVPSIDQFTNQSLLQVTTGLSSVSKSDHFIRLITYINPGNLNQVTTMLTIDGGDVPKGLFQQ